MMLRLVITRASRGAAILMVALTLGGCGAPVSPTPPAAEIVAATHTPRMADAPEGLPTTPANTPPGTTTPARTQTAAPSGTPLPSPTASPLPTATPTPVPQAVRLTAGGCCTQPFWSPESRQVRFIDKPAPDAAVGIWGVALDASLQAPVLVTERVEESLARGDILVEADGELTVIERLSNGQRWTVSAARGRNVLLSPGQERIAWSVTDDNLPSEGQVAAVWVANLDGSAARQVAVLPRGGLSGWISEGALLVSVREGEAEPQQVLSVLSLADGTLTELARAGRLRSAALSPSGAWVAYYTTFEADSARNGLWLARTDPASGDGPQPLPRGLFGAYQWRGCPGACSPEQDRLLLVPFRPDAEHHHFVELDPATLAARPLTDPQVTPFKIANGDWRVSPDGRYVAFVESSDRNIWVIALP